MAADYKLYLIEKHMEGCFYYTCQLLKYKFKVLSQQPKLYNNYLFSCLEVIN